MTTTAPLNLKYTRPWLYPKQQAAVFDPTRFAVIEASTKSGKTVGCIVWLTEQALFDGAPGRHYWWVAPIYAQAKIAYRRLKRGLPPQIFQANESELTITLFNGAVIWFKGGDKPDSLYGEDVYGVVIDEASRCKDDVWTAIQTVVTATEAPIRVIGNVKGRANWAWRLGRRALAGESGLSYHRITADDAIAAGVLRASSVATAQQNLSRQEYLELYEAIGATEVEGALWKRYMFDPDRLRQPPHKIVGDVDYGPDLIRVIVGVDPSGSKTGDEVGIVVGGKGGDGCGYILDDRSAGGLSPHEWGQRAVQAYYDYQADSIVAESNYGGDMVENTIKMVDRSVPVKLVRATRGKAVRAQPVATLYEKEPPMIYHAKVMPELEDQLCTWTAESGQSPDRLDAMVWVGTELLVTGGEPRVRFL